MPARTRAGSACGRSSSPTSTWVRADCRADGTAANSWRRVEVDYLFLVGDIVDFWSLRQSFYWPQEHNEVLRAILGKAREGTRVIYVPGNHDEDMREFCGSVFGNLEIRRKYVHATADGRELLVMHGDEFDTAVKCSRWLARFGATRLRVHAAPQSLPSTRCRRLFGLPYWSLATYLKLRLKNAVRYVDGIRTCRGAGGRAAQAATASSAATSTAPACATSTACSTATMATGWRAAPRWSRT